MSPERRYYDARRERRQDLIDNLIAFAACTAVGALLGLLIGIGMRMHP